MVTRKKCPNDTRTYAQVVAMTEPVHTCEECVFGTKTQQGKSSACEDRYKGCPCCDERAFEEYERGVYFLNLAMKTYREHRDAYFNTYLHEEPWFCSCEEFTFFEECGCRKRRMTWEEYAKYYDILVFGDENKQGMSSTNHSSFLKTLNLPSNFNTSIMHIRVNGNVVHVNDGGEGERVVKEGEHCHYVNGHFIFRRGSEGELRWNSFTVVNGVLETNFSCCIDIEGRVLSGKVNTFAFGYMDIDQDYIDTLLEEWRQREESLEWDVVKLNE